jgi:hypothetical protein
MISVKIHISECLKVEKLKLYQNHQRKNNRLKMLNVIHFVFIIRFILFIVFLIAVCIQSGTKIALFNRLRYEERTFFE